MVTSLLGQTHFVLVHHFITISIKCKKISITMEQKRLAEAELSKEEWYDRFYIVSV